MQKTLRCSPKMTMFAGMLGYVIQAMVYNFFPLLYIIFGTEFRVTISKIAFLTTINFTTQIISGLMTGKLADRFGYRKCAIAMESIILFGILFLTVSTRILPNAYLGAMLSTGIIGIGAGIQESLTPAVIQSCPGDNKGAVMSLANACYSFGATIVIMLSTLFFYCFGTEHWRVLTCLWILLPLCDLILYSFVPIYSMNDYMPEEIGKPEKIGKKEKLLSLPVYRLLLLLIFCAGACDVGYSQWISSFMESAVHLDKTLGDMLGPTAFTLACGCARLGYAAFGKRFNLERSMQLSAVICVCGFLLTAIAPVASFAAAGCILSGLGVGILYPGTVSLTATRLTNPSTQAITLLAVGGSVGSTVISTMVGVVADGAQTGLRAGYYALVVVPVAALIVLYLLRKKAKKYR